MTPEDKRELIALLERRLEVIADGEWREQNPDAQLAELVRVGEGIFAIHAKFKGTLPPRLEHFLEGCSYDKALALLKSDG